MGAMVRPMALMCAFVVGWFCPQGAVLSWTIPWFVRFMLFMTFLGLNVHKMKLRRSHFAILALNILIGVGACAILRRMGYPALATAAFFTGMAPTATAAPAIASFLRREVEYVVTSVLLTTFGIAIATPLLIPWAVGMETAAPGAFFDAFLRVAWTVVTTIVAPIVAARLLRLVYPSAQTWTKRFKIATFYAWVLMVTVISCRAAGFIQNPENGVKAFVLIEAALTALAICVIDFTLGFFVGEKGLREESSQSLGQKNTGVMIYFAVLYASPIAALGPTLYVLWHNSWNAIQLQYQAIKDVKAEHAAKRAESTK